MKKILKILRQIISYLSAYTVGALGLLCRLVFGRYLAEFVFAVREGFLRAELKRMGKWARIGKGCKFTVPGSIEIGNDVYVGEFCVLEGSRNGKGIRIADNVKIRHGCVFNSGDDENSGINIGSGVHINDHCCFYGRGSIEIGNNVLIGPGVTITSVQHSFSDNDRNKLIIEQPEKIRKVLIEEDVWIGAHVVILPGIKIGKGAVIGACAVVTKDIPQYSVAWGVPASAKRTRG